MRSMAQKKNSSMYLSDDDRAAIAAARKILEQEHKGIKFSMAAVFRAVIFFFLDAKKTPTQK